MQQQSKRDKKLRFAAERALITRFMPQKDYDRLAGKYSHATVFQAFSNGASALTDLSKRQIRVMALHRFVYRWRVRLERLLSWLEEGKRNGNSS